MLVTAFLLIQRIVLVHEQAFCAQMLAPHPFLNPRPHCMIRIEGDKVNSNLFRADRKI